MADSLSGLSESRFAQTNQLGELGTDPSAILGLTGTGNVSQADLRRYQNYLDQIEVLPQPTDDSPYDFIERIKSMEHEAMLELEAFCTQVDSVSVRI